MCRLQNLEGTYIRFVSVRKKVATPRVLPLHASEVSILGPENPQNFLSLSEDQQRTRARPRLNQPVSDALACFGG